MKTYLNVLYAKKETAKSHGARWDSQRKQWYYAGDVLPDGLKQFVTTSASSRRFCRCPSCGTTGYSGAYPFTTLPPTCDDCV